MTMLSGKLKPSSGELCHLLGGVKCPPSRFRKLQGFVPQNDVMIECLTVKEQLW